LYIIAPGKAYRRDIADPSHTPMFHQIEGLAVDEKLSFGDLKGTLEVFVKRLFGEERAIRLRPHFFPFTEPSAEVDVSCSLCLGKGCRLCGGNGWLEILGCGMVDPNVLEEVGVDSEKYRGFAFGMGIERIAVLKHGLDDIRRLYDNDIRFLEQF
ncbi:MAG: phenylalanine--tRNA ligase subunit alpha, partial [Actinobacteria bacterium]